MGKKKEVDKERRRKGRNPLDSQELKETERCWGWGARRGASLAHTEPDLGSGLQYSTGGEWRHMPVTPGLGGTRSFRGISATE